MDDLGTHEKADAHRQVTNKHRLRGTQKVH